MVHSEAKQVHVKLSLLPTPCAVENAIDHPNRQRCRLAFDGLDQLVRVATTHPLQRANERAGSTYLCVWHPLHDIKHRRDSALRLRQCHQLIGQPVKLVNSFCFVVKVSWLQSREVRENLVEGAWHG